jgi:glycosyltransferase involved in cell wall biosynthesis
MKLFIQIPCLNEEKTLPVVLADIPQWIEGIDEICTLVIDDCSSDNTAEAARANGVDYVIQLKKNQGLAKGFMTGLDVCVKLGADIIVNIDADNQYNAQDIQKLVQPILDGKAEYVIGARPIVQMEHFSFVKKCFQSLGSWVVRVVSRTDISDAPCGFRAISRDAAMKLNVFNDYTYTLETIIQAGQKNMAICSVPIGVNKDIRPSRLIKNTASYIHKSAVTILRIFVIYKPFRFFMLIGSLLFAAGFLMGLRFLYFLCTGRGHGHIQSVVLTGILLGMGFQTILIAFIADLLSVNRKLLEDIQYRVKKSEIDK